MRIGEETKARLKVHQRRLICRRGFSSLAGDQIELGQSQAFRVGGDERTGEVQVSDEVEHLLWRSGTVPSPMQEATNLQVHQLLVIVGDLRIGGLLHTVV